MATLASLLVGFIVIVGCDVMAQQNMAEDCRPSFYFKPGDPPVIAPPQCDEGEFFWSYPVWNATIAFRRDRQFAVCFRISTQGEPDASHYFDVTNDEQLDILEDDGTSVCTRRTFGEIQIRVDSGVEEIQVFGVFLPYRIKYYPTIPDECRPSFYFNPGDPPVIAPPQCDEGGFFWSYPVWKATIAFTRARQFAVCFQISKGTPLHRYFDVTNDEQLAILEDDGTSVCTRRSFGQILMRIDSGVEEIKTFGQFIPYRIKYFPAYMNFWDYFLIMLRNMFASRKN